MTTPAQIEANRQNAQKSTGPKTPEGKAVASQNSTTHGLRSNRVLITSENSAEYNAHQNALLEDLAPVGAMETILADRIIKLTWQLNRSTRFQTCTFNTLIKNKAHQKLGKKVELKPMDYLRVDVLEGLGIFKEEYYKLLDEKGYDGMEKYIDNLIRQREMQNVFREDADHSGDQTLGEVVYADFSQSRALERLLMYERRIENSLYKAHLEFQRLQLLRQKRTAAQQEQEIEHPEKSALSGN